MAKKKKLTEEHVVALTKKGLHPGASRDEKKHTMKEARKAMYGKE